MIQDVGSLTFGHPASPSGEAFKPPREKDFSTASFQTGARIIRIMAQEDRIQLSTATGERPGTWSGFRVANHIRLIDDTPP